MTATASYCNHNQFILVTLLRAGCFAFNCKRDKTSDGLSQACLEALHTIRTLEIEDITPAALRALEASSKQLLSTITIPGVTKAILYECDRNIVTLAQLDLLPNLFVNLESFGMTTAGTTPDEVATKELGELRGFCRLKHLVLTRSSFCHNAKSLSNPIPPSLESLNLHNCGKVTNFSFLRTLTNLRRLNLRFCALTLPDLYWLHRSIPLTHLDVSGTGIVCDKLLGYLMERSYPIEELDVGHDRGSEGFTIQGLQGYLEWTSSLKSLDVWKSRMDNRIFDTANNCLKHLEWLGVMETGCTADGFFRLFRKREALRLTGVQLPNLVVHASDYQVPIPALCWLLRRRGLSITRRDKELYAFFRQKLGRSFVDID